jgi:hypothetical protein
MRARARARARRRSCTYEDMAPENGAKVLSGVHEKKWSRVFVVLTGRMID